MFRKTVRLLSRGNIPREVQTTPTSPDSYCAVQEVQKFKQKSKNE